MKSCPACNRTFEDTLTFCLVDGSILSAPFNPSATHEQPGARRTSPPPTEVMPPPPAWPANAPPPTILSPPQMHNAVSPAQPSYPLYGHAVAAGAPQKKKGKALWPLSLTLVALWFMLVSLRVGGSLTRWLLIMAAAAFIIDAIRMVRGRR
ncbi:MAG TPA: hypothetical protein VGC87_20060 [Pyrinomonadaceae bacterium]|jgi:hypothetical protein